MRLRGHVIDMQIPHVTPACLWQNKHSHLFFEDPARDHFTQTEGGDNVWNAGVTTYFLYPGISN